MTLTVYYFYLKISSFTPVLSIRIVLDNDNNDRGGNNSGNDSDGTARYDNDGGKDGNDDNDRSGNNSGNGSDSTGRSGNDGGKSGNDHNDRGGNNSGNDSRMVLVVMRMMVVKVITMTMIAVAIIVAMIVMVLVVMIMLVVKVFAVRGHVIVINFQNSSAKLIITILFPFITC